MVRAFGIRLRGVDVLDLKLVRDLWAMLPQVATIALLIASGISVLVMSGSNYLALLQAMDDHYRNERFADAFASLKRAPLTLAERLRGIDGIGVVEPRISHRVRVIRADSEQSIAGRVLSIPARGQPQLNRLKLVSGRWIDPLHRDEVIINAAYAQARRVRPGDAIDVVLNGRMQAFRVAGIALSPEFVFATRSALHLRDLQAVERDFAFVVDARVEALTLVNAAAGADKALIEDVRVFDEFTGGSLGEGKKSLAVTVRLQPSDKTLTEAEIESVSAKIVEKVGKATGGVLRG